MSAHTAGLLFVLSGPSGVGKDAVLKLMRATDVGVGIYYPVTATTRHIRPGEVHGVDYLFLTTGEFERMLTEDGFFEHAEVYGNHYGIPKTQVLEPLERGQDVLLKIDVQGADTVKTKEPRAIRIFLAPPSYDDLKARLEARLTESEEALRRRLQEAEAEMAYAGEFDHVVYNHDGQLEAAVDEIRQIIENERQQHRLAVNSP